MSVLWILIVLSAPGFLQEQSSGYLRLAIHVLAVIDHQAARRTPIERAAFSGEPRGIYAPLISLRDLASDWTSSHRRLASITLRWAGETQVRSAWMEAR